MGVFAKGIISAFVALGALAAQAASAAPSLVVDMASGEVLHQQEATRSWYPASLTKLMTVYVALKAVRDGRLTMETPLVMSPRAARMAPSKMGFKPGVEVTLDNALKMLMVKSANDIAVAIAEGVSGSVEAFADDMNRAAAQLGMRESHFVNPNGLPDERQVTSARDMAVLGRALYMQFPEHGELFGIGALKLGNQVLPTHNGLLGRYPGADGMKTGFTCAAGFNVVASASGGGRRLITVIMGAPSAADRTILAMALFDKGFAAGGGQGSIASLPSAGLAAAPNMRDEICRRRGKGGALPAEAEDMAEPLITSAVQELSHNPERAFLFEQVNPANGRGGRTRLGPRPHFEPVAVYVGRAPGYSGPPAMNAYAAQKPAKITAGQSPIEADANALPLRGRKRVAAKPARPAAAVAAKAGQKTAAEAKGKTGGKAVAAKTPKAAAAKATPKGAAKPKPKAKQADDE